MLNDRILIQGFEISTKSICISLYTLYQQLVNRELHLNKNCLNNLCITRTKGESSRLVADSSQFTLNLSKPLPTERHGRALLQKWIKGWFSLVCHHLKVEKEEKGLGNTRTFTSRWWIYNNFQAISSF